MKFVGEVTPMAMTPETNLEKTAAKLIDSLEKQYRFTYGAPVKSLKSAKKVLVADALMQIAVIRQAIDRFARLRDKLGGRVHMNLHIKQEYPEASLEVAGLLFRRKLPFSDADFVFMISRTAHLRRVSIFLCAPYLPRLVALVEKHVQTNGLSELLDKALGRLSKALKWIGNAPERKLREKIDAIRSGPQPLPIQPGEAWSDATLTDLNTMGAKQKAAWAELVNHCQTSAGSTPSAKWVKAAEWLMGNVGRAGFKKRMLAWFPLVDKPRTQVIEHREAWFRLRNLLIIDPHMDILKGLAWCCSLEEDGDVARALGTLALSAYKKVPGIGPRAVRVGNACVYALGVMPGSAGVAQLAILKVKIKFGTAQKLIDKALDEAAHRLELPRDEIEEMAVPAYGLEEVGVRREQMGEFTAELRISAKWSAELSWVKADGKQQMSVPAAIKKEHADDLKELKATAKDIEKMLPAQRERIDSLFLQQKSWPLATWRERYLDHPLVGTIARRVIWRFRTRKTTAEGIYFNGQLLRHDDKPLKKLGESTTVELWHPINEPPAQVLAWRAWLERHEVRQPFKQAHREVYLLTDAERRARVYSNRFAAHVIRQHQFKALCAVRGWKHKLRLVYDEEFPATTLYLPKWNLRAEYWVEGEGDTNEIGAYLYLTTDQVRFFLMDAARPAALIAGSGSRMRPGEGIDAPIALEHLPPLVFSEVMRDVDLFVGVASVGNDPTWSDGGPDGRYRDYWHDYSFGELSATAETRRQVLERLIPRLKIADRCSFSDRFLLVRGDIRTYKIHLGSGNILMSPNDQYLCIVGKQTAAVGSDRVFLPFEGDNTLAVILSKAFLLADDTKITDPAITSQIGRKRMG
ncbi:MAG: DUF4132 domain-containing protein [Planctomycetes bacterium]|nr:DUF4132 domain-containing protein [Planctomycetota bacterium]